MSDEIEMILFEAAAALPDETDRRLFLAHTCQDNPGRLRLLESLLAKRKEAEDFFSFQASPPSPTARNAAPLGEETLATHIGRYRLVERLGSGGYGTVYLAEQIEPLQRKVALKIIRLGMDTERMIARFKMERQALARMEHPHIARVFDAGTTHSGRPYFVMELVDGEKVTSFCDREKLTLGERLELFIQICRAIQHAHQKGVIHRDIKPSNILVRRQQAGTLLPKVIDFGIAKAAHGTNEQTLTLENPGQLLGTPTYMSPEQASGSRDIDTRSDIYSLGVLLFEMLVGQPPFDFSSPENCNVEEVRAILRKSDPPKPATLLAALPSERLAELAALRGTTGRQLMARVQGDLSWILLKALEKDRSRRYETANGLASDIQRHLQGEPVSAGPPGRRYRLGKLIQRNRMTFLSGGLLLFALLAGLGTSSWMFLSEREARQEQSRLRKIAEEARRLASQALANEMVLRRQAEHRDLVAQAAFQLSLGERSKAESLLSRIPLAEIPPSLEAANTYRTLGEWHFNEARWKEAAKSFAGLARTLSDINPADSEQISRHLLPAAAALCSTGADAEYEVFREMAVARFGDSADVHVAEQVLKATLLRPANERLLAAITPLANLVENHLRTEAPSPENSEIYAWRHLSLCLHSYRRDQPADAAAWGREGLRFAGEKTSRDASLHFLLAMTASRSGQSAEARSHFQEGRRLIAKESTTETMTNNADGYWFDWINASLLREEAAALLP
ncbi:serine/threonine protein kinase [Roseibacillus ishigakijimensis]|uniref:Serine/threonine protein kinase n=1 Tax=Roseibacillus ishigakijimensis TaxID=454146 RepID=A0A934RRW9_9BACT|nr:serine/threonine-protein kinase [Roseibacillus ishigakijimensis]MBK1834807.1 serine/threonine protein kinase [Roseibacillus ishigakijimensis]